VLVIAGKNWEKYEVAADRNSIKLQPGIVGQRVNEILKPFGKKFPPDPASVKSAMVGGIILNNASGMSCGTHENSYKTIISARLIFADGTLLDTADTQSKENFRQSHPDFINKNNVKNLYSNEDKSNEFIISKDRFNVTRKFNLLSVSCAIIEINPRSNISDFDTTLNILKKESKGSLEPIFRVL